jgi:hypothetical protein
MFRGVDSLFPLELALQRQHCICLGMVRLHTSTKQLRAVFAPHYDYPAMRLVYP